MQLRELEEMYAAETGHWWYRGKRILFERLLGPRLRSGRARILDAGCGTGAVAVHFSAFGSVTAADRSLDALSFARSRGINQVVAAAAPELPFEPGTFDVIFALDVIEHVEDDAAFVRGLRDSLAEDGVLAIHVPAWPSLWSRHDEVLEHKRRYTRRALKTLLETNGLVLERFGWTNCLLLPVAFAMRGIRRLIGGESEGQDLGDVPAPLNAALVAWYRLEAALAATTGLPWGLSLMAIARRAKS